MDFFKKTIFIFIAFNLFACRSTPIPPLERSSEKIRFEMQAFKQESDQILNISLKNLIPEYGQGYLDKNCISRSKAMPTGVVKSVKYCYYVDFSKQTIFRVNATRCRIKQYSARGDDCGYTFILSGIVDAFTTTELIKEYNKNSEKFLTYYENFINYSDEMTAKLEKLEVSLIDNTSILSKKELNTLSQFSWNRTHKNLVRSSQNDADFSESFSSSVRWEGSNLDKRFVLANSFSSVDINVNRQSAVIFELDDLYFNYSPETFEIGDERLNVIVKTSITEHGRLGNVEIQFQNNTDKFLNIDQLAGYFNGKVISDVLKQNGDPISLPPRSTKSTILSKNLVEELYGSGTIAVKSRMQKVQYGFSLQYYSSDVNRKSDLYKVKDITIDQLLYEI